MEIGSSLRSSEARTAGRDSQRAPSWPSSLRRKIWVGSARSTSKPQAIKTVLGRHAITRTRKKVMRIDTAGRQNFQYLARSVGLSRTIWIKVKATGGTMSHIRETTVSGRTRTDGHRRVTTAPAPHRVNASTAKAGASHGLRTPAGNAVTM